MNKKLNELLEFVNLQVWVVVAVHLFFAIAPYYDQTIKKISKYTLILITVNSLLNVVLKNIIKQPRPTNHPTSVHDYGMPSGHAQFVGLYVPYIIITHIIKQDFHESTKWILSVMVIIIGSIIVWSRVYLNYHTTFQVIVGLIIGLTGSLFGIHLHYQLSE